MCVTVESAVGTVTRVIAEKAKILLSISVDGKKFSQWAETNLKVVIAYIQLSAKKY